MRRISVLTAALLVGLAGPSFAQEWIQYASKADLFGVNFPSEPKVQDITYTTEFGISLPGPCLQRRQRAEPLLGHRGRLRRRRKNTRRAGRAVQEGWRRERRLPERLSR